MAEYRYKLIIIVTHHHSSISIKYYIITGKPLLNKK